MSVEYFAVTSLISVLRLLTFSTYSSFVSAWDAVVFESSAEDFGELGNLNAPEEFASQQEKIKSGCTASVETLDLSLELIQLGLGETQASAEDLTAKMTELNSKITELSSQAQGLTTALQEVMAS